jgi:hypothetical protein
MVHIPNENLSAAVGCEGDAMPATVVGEAAVPTAVL